MTPFEKMAVQIDPGALPPTWGQLAVLLGLGSMWAAMVFAATQQIKAGLGVRRPYSSRARLLLAFGPPVVSGTLAIYMVPFAMYWVGMVPPEQPGALMAYAAIGAAGGLVGQGFYDGWREVAHTFRIAVEGRIRHVIGGTDGTGGTASHDEEE